MHRLSRLLVRTRQKTDSSFDDKLLVGEGQKALHPIIDDKIRLPTELLLLIVSYIQNRTDIVALCRVSKLFNVICRPLLYKVVNIAPKRGKEEAYLRFYYAVQKPPLSHIITEFSITISANALCRRWDPNNSPFTTPCTCDKHDQYLVKVIQSLLCLRSFTIMCYLCDQCHDHRHFFRVDSSMLREFKLVCHGSTFSLLRQSILRAPFMSTITALTLGARHPSRGWSSTEDVETMQDMNVLPHLTTLSHNGDAFCDLILSQRPVQRLCRPQNAFNVANMDDFKLDGPIRKSPGTLSYLFTYHLFRWLPSYMKPGAIEPYCNLRFIGILTCTKHREDDILVEMEVFAPLIKLEFMEINRRWDPNTPNPPKNLFTPSQRFVELLGHQHRLLHRVLLLFQGLKSLPQNAILWEKSKDGWKSRRVPPLEFWDIVRDKLDEI